MTGSRETENTNIESVFTVFYGFARCFDGINEGGRVYGIGSDERGDVKSTPPFEEAYAL